MQEAAEGLAQTISHDAFNDLLDLMHEDRVDSQDDSGLFDSDLPKTPADIPKLRALTTLPTYVWAPEKSAKPAVIARILHASWHCPFLIASEYYILN